MKRIIIKIGFLFYFYALDDEKGCINPHWNDIMKMSVVGSGKETEHKNCTSINGFYGHWNYGVSKDVFKFISDVGYLSDHFYH